MFTLDRFTEEKNLKQFIINTTLSQVTNSSDIEQLYDIHAEGCRQGDLSEKITFNGQNRTISCDDILKTEKEKYVELVIEKLIFNDLYYKNYPCTFLECMTKKETVPVLLSSQGRHFINSLKMFLVIGAVIALLLVFVLSDGIAKALKTSGWAFFLIGGSYLAMLVSFPFKELIIEGAKMNLAETAKVILSPMELPAVLLFSTGVLMMILGVALNFYNGKGILAKVFRRKPRNQ
jgi:hypothetical protein